MLWSTLPLGPRIKSARDAGATTQRKEEIIKKGSVGLKAIGLKVVMVWEIGCCVSGCRVGPWDLRFVGVWVSAGVGIGSSGFLKFQVLRFPGLKD